MNCSSTFHRHDTHLMSSCLLKKLIEICPLPGVVCRNDLRYRNLTELSIISQLDSWIEFAVNPLVVSSEPLGRECSHHQTTLGRLQS